MWSIVWRDIVYSFFTFQYLKITKLECNLTDYGMKRCPNQYCTVRSVSRYQTYFSFGCDLQVPLSAFFVSRNIKFHSKHKYFDKTLKFVFKDRSQSFYEKFGPAQLSPSNFFKVGHLHDCPRFVKVSGLQNFLELY